MTTWIRIGTCLALGLGGAAGLYAAPLELEVPVMQVAKDSRDHFVPGGLSSAEESGSFEVASAEDGAPRSAGDWNRDRAVNAEREDAGCAPKGCVDPILVESPALRRKPVGSTQPDANFPIKGALRFRTMHRWDSLDWSIAGDNIKVLSELKWRGVQATGLEMAGNLELPYQLVAVGRGSYGRIHQGNNQDSDFTPLNQDGTGPTVEFSRSNNGGDRGSVIDGSLAIGHTLYWGPAELQWTPLLGYAYNRQNLNMNNGKQTIPADGAFGGLNSDYEATWMGPWTGLQLGFQPHARLHVSAGAEYHFMGTYSADANWNLRSDFRHPKSFTHRADSTGWVLSTEMQWQMTRRWTIELAGRWMDFSTDPGRDTVFFDGSVLAPGDSPAVSTRLNPISWKSMQLVLGATLQF